MAIKRFLAMVNYEQNAPSPGEVTLTACDTIALGLAQHKAYLMVSEIRAACQTLLSISVIDAF